MPGCLLEGIRVQERALIEQKSYSSTRKASGSSPATTLEHVERCLQLNEAWKIFSGEGEDHRLVDEFSLHRIDIGAEIWGRDRALKRRSASGRCRSRPAPLCRHQRVRFRRSGWLSPSCSSAFVSFFSSKSRPPLSTVYRMCRQAATSNGMSVSFCAEDHLLANHMAETHLVEHVRVSCRQVGNHYVRI